MRPLSGSHRERRSGHVAVGNLAQKARFVPRVGSAAQAAVPDSHFPAEFADRREPDGEQVAVTAPRDCRTMVVGIHRCCGDLRRYDVFNGGVITRLVGSYLPNVRRVALQVRRRWEREPASWPDRALRQCGIRSGNACLPGSWPCGWPSGGIRRGSNGCRPRVTL